MTLTPLEKLVLHSILSEELGARCDVKKTLDLLEISKRSFSFDHFNREFCCGFYLNFSSNTLLSDIGPVSHHYSLHALHPDIPSGGDFILFSNETRTGIDLLEATFFDYTLPIARLLSVEHGFQLG